MNGKTEIWESVEQFRQKHLGDLGKVPVDVLTVIEVRLRLDVIPFDRLFEKYSVDAAVLPDFSGIYVDKRSYRFLEGQPPWLFNRLRFSLAHELGHILLHREKAGDLRFKALEDYRAWMRRYEASRYVRAMGSHLNIEYLGVEAGAGVESVRLALSCRTLGSFRASPGNPREHGKRSPASSN
ncbi:MAG: ImmA/IrrE family metallo-endopeptidase [Verrucomicrobiota bacterium]